MKEITLEQFKEKKPEEYLLVDIRDEGSILYGKIPGAINIPITKFEEDFEAAVGSIDADKDVIIYCQRGEKSQDIADLLESKGISSFSLAGGYNAFLMSLMDGQDEEDFKERAEESIRKKFHKQLFSPFAKACKTYDLIQNGDHIAVCIS